MHDKRRFHLSPRRPAVLAAIFLGGLVLTQVAALYAQRSSVYGGSGPDWWTAGLDSLLPRQDDYEDSSGRVRMTISTGIVHSKDHPFFEALGSNQRACITCHQPSNGMSVSAEGLRKRWADTAGKDAVFAAVDGANCPDLPQDAMASHSLLLDHGLFRIALPWPPRNAQGAPIQPDFRIDVVSDPTGCNNSPAYGLRSSQPAISVFRRPRMTANLRYVPAGPDGLILMADGRESTLRSQAISAATTHEAAAIPDEEQLRQIVEFETRVYVAQGSDLLGGLLNELGGPALLGPENLEEGKAPTLDGALLGKSFEPWRKAAEVRDAGLRLEFRASVARGSDVFFGRQFHIPEAATCASCHSRQAPLYSNVGTSNVPAATRSATLPVFRITCNSGPVIYTNDPGRALISGKCADAGAFVIQQFHGLSSRAPYFANGSAATLTDVVDHYERRFKIGLTSRERQDLTNFLRAL